MSIYIYIYLYFNNFQQEDMFNLLKEASKINANQQKFHFYIAIWKKDAIFYAMFRGMLPTLKLQYSYSKIEDGKYCTLLS